MIWVIIRSFTVHVLTDQLLDVAHHAFLLFKMFDNVLIIFKIQPDKNRLGGFGIILVACLDLGIACLVRHSSHASFSDVGYELAL